MLSLEQLSQVVQEHLGFRNSNDSLEYCSKWIVADSPLGGRGLIATEDIESGDVLFVDHPLIHGPRSGTTVERSCIVCCKIDYDLLFKCSKCALLLCSEECEYSREHYDACHVISRWHNKVPIEDIDDTIMSRTLTPIRALLLNHDQRQFMSSLQAHTLPQHGSEIKELQKYFEIPQNQVQLMILACRVLDANAFQIGSPYGKNEVSQRGLYPVSALMNHSCESNTRYCYNFDHQMTVKAVKPIRAGSEIFSCYCGQLWGTPARRTYLYKTKHFLCNCSRCADPSERGTLLAALKCFSANCPGSLLPIEPLKLSTAWQCLECSLRVPNKNVCAIQGALGSLMGTVNFDNVGELENFLVHRVVKYIPKTNQIIVDLQCRLIWAFGDSSELRWHDLSESRLALKESLCRGTLRTLEALGVGDVHLRGLLQYHLHAALAERARRSPDQYEDLKAEIECTIEKAHSILHGDISAPPDLELRYRYLGPGCEKPNKKDFLFLILDHYQLIFQYKGVYFCI